MHIESIFVIQKGGMVVNEKIRTGFKTDVTFAVDFEG